MQDRVSFDVEHAITYALNRLEHDLPAELVYHSLAHTRDEVEPVAIHLAHMEGIVNDESLLLLHTAAYYHDIGYVEDVHNHEAAGVRIARTVLPYFGYCAAQIDVIDGLIMATRQPQSPRTPLERILADADLDSLGRLDFIQRSLDLYAEVTTLGDTLSLAEWYQRQLEFLSTHCYFTSSACAMRNRGKQNNIELLRHMLARG